MKYRIAVLAVIVATFTLSLQAEEEGRRLFEAKCSGCHLAQKPTPAQRSGMVAPPAMGVMYHVKERYGERPEAIAFIVDYVLEPKREKAVCMERSIRRFGLMPSQKGVVSEAELEKIAAYMYDTFPPAGFRHPKMGGPAGR